MGVPEEEIEKPEKVEAGVAVLAEEKLPPEVFENAAGEGVEEIVLLGATTVPVGDPVCIRAVQVIDPVKVVDNVPREDGEEVSDADEVEEDVGLLV